VAEACQRLGRPRRASAADNQTTRNLSVAVPDTKVKLVLAYPMTTGRNLDEVPLVINSRQPTARHTAAGR